MRKPSQIERILGGMYSLDLFNFVVWCTENDYKVSTVSYHLWKTVCKKGTKCLK